MESPLKLKLLEFKLHCFCQVYLSTSHIISTMSEKKTSDFLILAILSFCLEYDKDNCMFIQFLVMTSWKVICEDGKTLTLPVCWTRVSMPGNL